MEHVLDSYILDFPQVVRTDPSIFTYYAGRDLKAHLRSLRFIGSYRIAPPKWLNAKSCWFPRRKPVLVNTSSMCDSPEGTILYVPSAKRQVVAASNLKKRVTDRIILGEHVRHGR